ncbi:MULTISPECIES: recombinase family protein [unclassified Novosphingobium]|uniref:recombinase family protein n=1 Tax=unclassified Novosphingobium TaxID=2644732 RepID=UPI00146A92B7|nr:MULTISPECIES: recombinase family protein [unclassified Novosphingobium]NMN07530.1 DNA invertase Pin-like site-specific DNA recombinase [Novosphingobium sp. SG919]NMN89867.1 DNA invertase Pin-like site-specific DNA recombinase [Novosphingobium sp. SG916]
MKIGYARVSTGEQNLALQRDALRAAGCEKIYEDHGVSGSAVIKPQYDEALRAARAGDEVIVWRLDRLSRSLLALIAELQQLSQLGLGFRSLTEQIETVTPAGQLFFHIVGAFAQFERDVIRERTRAGLESARRVGKRLGRPPAVSDEQWQAVRKLMRADPPLSPAQAAKLLGISRQAVHKRLKAEAAG